MNELIETGVGVLAACLSMASFPPQIVKIVRERDAEAVSMRMYLATVAGFAAWTAYALMIGSWPLVGSNLINFVLAGTILVLKLRFRDRSARAPSVSGKARSTS